MDNDEVVYTFPMTLFLFGHKLRRWSWKDEMIARKRYMRRLYLKRRYLRIQMKLNPGLWRSPLYRRWMEIKRAKYRYRTYRIHKAQEYGF